MSNFAQYLSKIAFVLFVGFGCLQIVGAATLTVTRIDDRNDPTCVVGDCSLREAVTAANADSANDTIIFDLPAASCNSLTGVCTITLGAEIVPLTATGALKIIGTGANRLIIDGGAGNNRIFFVNGVDFTLSGVTLTGGNAGGNAEGGAVYITGNQPTLIKSVYFLANSSPTSSGGGIALVNAGTNKRLENCAFSGNSANQFGGGVYVQSSNLEIVNTTINGNTASSGGGGIGSIFSGTLTLRNDTITANTGFGGGVYLDTGALNFGNSIIAGNINASFPEIYNSVGGASSAGYNLIGDSPGDSANTGVAITYTTGDIQEVPPLLDSLGYYGGGVPTMRLQFTGNPLSSSVAIDQGCFVTGINADARGVIRPYDFLASASLPGCNGADMGAFELIPNFALGWGRSNSGEVGDGNTISTPVPVQLAGGFADVAAIEGGFVHGLGLLSDGRVISWGFNGVDQLGRATSTTAQQATPTLIPGLNGVVATSGGGNHSLAILADGTVEAWGEDIFGQLGDGTSGGSRANRLTVKIDSGGTQNLTNIIAVAGGNAHGIALDGNGKVWTWGNDSSGQLGDGAGDSSRAFAQPVPTLANVIAIDAGANHNLVVLSDGTIRAWGRNGGGQIGNNSTVNQFAPVQPNINGVTQIAAGNNHSVALDVNGKVFTWGVDFAGQLGDGTADFDVLTPTPISTINQVTEIKSTLGNVTFARKRDGSIFAWGFNGEGQIGDGTTSFAQPTPTQTALNSGIAVFGAAGLNGFASSPSASVTTGANQFVRLGDATVNFASVTTAGELQIRTFDPSASGLIVPGGYTILTNSNGYDISTGAQFNGTANVCLKVPTVIDATIFNLLFILHDDDGDGVLDRKLNPARDYQRREICRVTTSFSPFVLAIGSNPTAANVSVGGRIMTAAGRGIKNVRVTMTDADGTQRTAISTAFGHYRFAEVRAGETYIFMVRAKQFNFQTPTQIRSVNAATDDLNFIAD